HRNTYINGPTLLSESLQMKRHPNLLFAGQISGVEGYVESIATGLLAGMHAATLAADKEPVPPPRATALGALINYICRADAKNFQPANITFDLMQPLEEATRRSMRDKRQRHALVCRRALDELQAWLVAAGG
ncbi:MAG TPA: FAD-dependent oxidoreductase, partial [Terriglobales bacterium]|nr:FAD-dependent oxidoreductase [Terriglobales bacterium]